MAEFAENLPIDVTLGAGIRVTNITITTTPTGLDSLLNTAVSGRSSMKGRKTLKIRNMDGSNSFYIGESVAQLATATTGWPVAAGADFTAEASETFTENIIKLNVDNNGGGFYLACSSGTIAAKVLEAR